MHQKILLPPHQHASGIWLLSLISTSSCPGASHFYIFLHECDYLKCSTCFSVLLPGKCHGRRSLVGCSPWGPRKSDTTGQLHFHFSRSCIGEGNGNPLQWSCLENPRDGGAWWVVVYGVAAPGQTQLKWLSNSSSSSSYLFLCYV